MSQTLSSLARLTLRQLRQIASDLGVPLYSRKSKETPVSYTHLTLPTTYEV